MQTKMDGKWRVRVRWTLVEKAFYLFVSQLGRSAYVIFGPLGFRLHMRNPKNALRRTCMAESRAQR